MFEWRRRRRDKCDLDLNVAPPLKTSQAKEFLLSLFFFFRISNFTTFCGQVCFCFGRAVVCQAGSSDVPVMRESSLTATPLEMSAFVTKGSPASIRCDQVHQREALTANVDNSQLLSSNLWFIQVRLFTITQSRGFPVTLGKIKTPTFS